MVEFAKVTKQYGKTTAIDRISLKVQENGIYCLLGRNGAGKTTLMKLLAGHIAASEGMITTKSGVVSPQKMPANINFIESGSIRYRKSNKQQQTTDAV